MSAESLQSQIKDLLKRKSNLSKRNGQAASLQEYTALIAGLQEAAASAVGELNNMLAEIQAERQGYQNLFRVAQEGYFVTDLEGKIREANAIGATLLGKTQAEILGTSLPSYIHERE